MPIQSRVGGDWFPVLYSVKYVVGICKVEILSFIPNAKNAIRTRFHTIALLRYSKWKLTYGRLL